MDDNIADFVWDVLDMYRSLFDSYNKLPLEQKNDIDEDDIRFEGFDGNNEAEYLCYTDFILEDLERYKESRECGDDHNSHWPTVQKYSRMLAKYKQIKKDRYLSLDQIKEIITE